MPRLVKYNCCNNLFLHIFFTKIQNYRSFFKVAHTELYKYRKNHFFYLRFETLINILAFAFDINVTIKAVALVAANVVSALTVGLGITWVRHDLTFVDI